MQIEFAKRAEGVNRTPDLQLSNCAGAICANAGERINQNYHKMQSNLQKAVGSVCFNVPKSVILMLFSLSFFSKAWSQNGNSGFESNSTTGWTNDNSGTTGVQNNVVRTGSYAGSYSTSSSFNQRWRNDGNSVSVPNNSYIHFIVWINPNAGNSLSAGINLNGSNGAANGEQRTQNSWTRISHSRLNSSGAGVPAWGYVNSNNGGTGTVTNRIDDAIVYVSTSATTDVEKPGSATAFAYGSITSGAVTFGWANGTDNSTGIQNTIILRTSAPATSGVPVLNDQGVYSTAGGADGPNSFTDANNTTWVVLSTTIPSSVTSFTDNSVSAGTTYRYAVVHRDLAYNYSVALVSNSAIASDAETTSLPVVTASPATSVTAVSAILPGTILNDGGTAITTYGMEYSTTGNFANGTGTTLAGSNVSSNSYSVNLTGLSAYTTYYYRAYATNRDGTAYSGQLSFTTAGLNAPIATAATNVTDNEFTANWNGVAGATTYRLDVSTSPFTTATLIESFTTYTGGATYNGWQFSAGLGSYSTAASAGPSGANAVQFLNSGTTGTATSPMLAGTATELKFWLKSNGSSGSSFLVEGWNGVSWITIQTIESSSVSASNGPSGGTFFTYHSGTVPVLPGNISQFRFTYLKSAGNLAFDDVFITYNALNVDLLNGYNNLAVQGTSQPVAGLNPNTTYYYLIRAASTNSTSLHSNAIAVNTDKSSQVITFDPFGSKTFGDAPFSLTASVNSPLAVSYTSSNEDVATIDDKILTIVGAGETIITASQAGNAIYHPALNVQQRMIVGKATPIITWSDPAGITYGTALAATQLNAAANEAGTFVYTPASGTLLNAGSNQTLSVTFTPANTGNYHTITRTVNINVAQKTLTPFISVSDKDYDGTTAAVITSRSFGAGETVGSDDVSLGTSGTALFETATARQNKVVNIDGFVLSGTGVANYVLSSTSATTTATIRKRTATVRLGSLSQTYTGSPLRATATTNPGGLTVNFTYNGSETAPVNEGSYTVIGTIADENYQGSGTGTLVIGPVMTTLNVTVQPGVLGGRTKVSATINPVLPNRMIGLTLDGNSLGNATTNSGGVVSWTINACANNALIVATFGGEINYAPATSNTAILSVATPVYHSNNWSGTNVRNDPQQLPSSGGVTVIPTITFTGVTLTDVTINWDDKTAPYTTAGPVTDYLTITGGHTYTAAGVYSPTLTGKDVCGNLITIPYQYIVIYNPNGGFVTGGGWVNSPPKAYKLDEALTGRANFGFVSRYQKGSTTVVEGETEFQFKLANLHFKSTSYEPSSLVIGGAKASYKGTGTINGAGSYKFMLTAVDGQITGGGGTDKIRMKITDAAGNLVYDNQVEGTAGDNADPTTVIAGGSIVIHVPKSGSTTSLIAQESVVTQTEPRLLADRLNAAVYPNPALSQFNIKLTSNNTRDAITLRVYNQLGQVMDVKRNLFSGQVIQVGAAYKQGTYFIEVTQGEQKQNIQLVKTN